MKFNIGFALMTVLLLNDPVRVYAEEPTQTPEVSQELMLQSKYFFPSQVKGASSDLRITAQEAEYDYNFKLMDKLPVDLGLIEDQYQIGNHKRFDLPARLVKTELSVETFLPAFSLPDTYFRLEVKPSFLSDDWDASPGSFRIPVNVGVVRQVNDRLALTAGISYFPEYVDKWEGWAGVVFKPNDRLAFTMVPPDPSISYQLNPHLDIYLESEFVQDEEFNVSRNNQNVTLAYNNLSAGGGIRYQWGKSWSISFGGGEAFGRKMIYLDNMQETEIKQGGYLHLNLNWKG